MRQLNDERIELIAECCHEVNRAYCEALGDGSQLPWRYAPDWQRASARDGVRFVLLGGHGGGDPIPGPEASHEYWMVRKLADGWRYGEVKDPEAKTHPCLVPYAELPPEQRAKDSIFLAVARLVDAALDTALTGAPPLTADGEALNSHAGGARPAHRVGARARSA